MVMLQEPEDGIYLMIVLIAGPRYKDLDIFYSKAIESYCVGFAFILIHMFVVVLYMD